MGVQGLGPFLAKHAPNSITPYSSLSSFANKTFAIDANLFTTKFHFIPPSSYSLRHSNLTFERHERDKCVRSWYFFLMALKREGIKPVVMFDGSTRITAKDVEVDKRSVIRELVKIRAEIEGDREVRLGELRELWEGGSIEDRVGVARMFKERTAKVILDDGEVDLVLSKLEITPQSELSPVDQASLLALETLHKVFVQDSTNQFNSPLQSALAVDTATFFDGILESALEGMITEDLTMMVDRSEKLASNYQRRGAGVPQHAHSDTLTLIKALGIPYFRPTSAEPYEAEGLCSSLYHHGLVDYVVTEDTDVTVYGAPLLRKISTKKQANVDAESQALSDNPEPRVEVKEEESGRNGKGMGAGKSMNVVDPVKVREALGMSKEMFIDFALLCGTDFTDRIPRCGPTKAVKLIQEHKTIEEILLSQTKYLPLNPDSYLTSIKIAREIFLNPPPLPASFSMKSEIPDPDLAVLLKGWGINVLPEESVVEVDLRLETREEIFESFDFDDIPPLSSSPLFPNNEQKVEASIGEWLETQEGAMGLSIEGSEGEVVELSSENESKSEEEIVEELMLCEGGTSTVRMEGEGEFVREDEERELGEGSVIG